MVSFSVCIFIMFCMHCIFIMCFVSKLNLISRDLLNKYPDEELTWDTMARRELEGLTYSDPNNASQLPLEPLLGVSAADSSIPFSTEAASAMEVDDDSVETSEKKGKSNLTQRLRCVVEAFGNILL